MDWKQELHGMPDLSPHRQVVVRAGIARHVDDIMLIKHPKKVDMRSWIRSYYIYIFVTYLLFVREEGATDAHSIPCIIYV